MNLSHEQALETGQRVVNSAVAQCLEVIGDRWILLAIRDLFLGRHRFEALLEHTGAARSTLANRLKLLVEQGIVYRKPYQSAPPRYEYRLTPKGLDLYDFALSVWSWEQTWSDGTTAKLPPRLFHRVCGDYFTPRCACTRCDQSITVQTVTNRLNSAPSNTKTRSAAAKRRSKVSALDHKASDPSLFHATDVLGDRWNNLILGGALYGLKRYDDFHRGLAISTNILAGRLRLLVTAGLMERVAYHTSPPRYQYNLTQKGRDYLPIAMSLHQWAEKWLLEGGRSNVILSHSCAAKPLQTTFRCSACEGALKPLEVAIS